MILVYLQPSFVGGPVSLSLGHVGFSRKCQLLKLRDCIYGGSQGQRLDARARLQRHAASEIEAMARLRLSSFFMLAIHVKIS